MTLKLKIRGGRVIDPAQGFDEVTDLFIADGVVQALGQAPDGFTPNRCLEAQGCVVTPGFVDLSARHRGQGLNIRQPFEVRAWRRLQGALPPS